MPWTTQRWSAPLFPTLHRARQLAGRRAGFFWAGVHGIPFNLVMIAAAAVFGPRYGVAALAVGFVAGSAARLLCQLVPLRRVGLRLGLSFDVADPGFRAIAGLVPALLLGSAIGNVNTLVDRAVGSVGGGATISALSYAWRLVGLAETLLVASLVTALYPAFGARWQRSRRAAPADLTGTRRDGGRARPVCAALLLAARPVVSLVHERGSFTSEDAALTATAVFWSAPALLALGWREVIARASLAVGDSRRPVTVAAVAMAINVIEDPTLGLAWGVSGLAASTTLSLVFAAATNTWLLRRRHHAVQVRPFLGLLGRVFAAAGSATAATGAALQLLPVEAGIGHALVVAAVVAVVLPSVFAATLFALRGPEGGVLRDAARLVTGRRR